jgi:hypothetical protein
MKKLSSSSPDKKSGKSWSPSRSMGAVMAQEPFEEREREREKRKRER